MAVHDLTDQIRQEKVAERYPRATLVLVGPVRVQADEDRAVLAALRAQPNVRFVGQVSVERVPQYMAACDVGLLPYKRNEWTRNIHPLKLYEYLACGLPVCSTDIPAVREQADVVRIATSVEQFITDLAASQSDDPNLSTVRQQRAAANTWQQRVERISALIAQTRAAWTEKDGSHAIGK